MKQGRSKRSKIIIGVISSVTTLVVLLFLMFNSGIDSLMMISGWVVVPIQNACIAIGDAVSGFFSGFGDNIELHKKYDELLLELDKYKIQDQKYQDILQENEQLRQIIGESERYSEFEFVIGRVTVSKASTYIDSYTINRGSADGIKENMVVVASGGLAGRVVEVSDNFCVMMSILDSRSSVPSIVERTRDTGVIKGTSVAGEVQSQCTMTYLPFELKSMTGDVVKTSGADDIFPKGIHIGSIVEISTGDTTLGTTAKIIPYVDFEHLEYVLILTDDGMIERDGANE